MPAPTSHLYSLRSPRTDNPRRHLFLVPLFLSAVLAAVALFVGLLVWRLVHVHRPDKPVMYQRTASVLPAAPAPPEVTIEVGAEAPEHTEAPPPPVLSSDVATQRLDVAPKPPTDTPPRLPEPLTADQIVEQRLSASEDDLRRELSAVPELRLLNDLDMQNVRAAERDAQKVALEAARANRRGVARSTLVAAVLAEQERIGHEFNVNLHQTLKQAAVRAGLPLRSGPNCQLAPDTAIGVAELSKELRDMGFVTVPGASSPSRSPDRGAANTPAWDSADDSPGGKTKAFQAWCDQHKVEQLSGTVPTLMQMLQIEDEATRLLLVRELTRIKSAGATAELAVRALMDLSPVVRRAALAALARRPWWQYVPVLLQGLRYPWPPVADRAAAALRALKPQDAVGKLVDLLDRPSPSVPILDANTNQYSVRELVRLNHLRNCLLCHAPSVNKEDGLVRGLVPTPGLPLPKSTPNGGGYYSSSRGDFVRADITFLRQDFSLVLLDKDVVPWPAEQRYDFVTRLRRASPEEIATRTDTSGNYPQREAVLYALRGITGKDAGDSSTRWREVLGLIARKPVEERKSPTLDKIAGPTRDKESLR